MTFEQEISAINGCAGCFMLHVKTVDGKKQKSDTWLPQSPVGGQGLYLRSPEHFGRSSEAKGCKNIGKVKT